MKDFKFRKIFWLGLGFFSINIIWQLYDFYVPLFLRDFIDSQFLINAVMTLDNILAITLIPYFASLSDRTNTKYGRRMPFLLIGIPLAAIFFSLLPNYNSLFGLVVVLFLLNISMSIFRAPTIALMPDITPTNLRSKANGIVNFMGGLGSVLVLSIGAILYSIGKQIPFYIGSVTVVLALILLKFTIKEDDSYENASEEKVSIIRSFKNIAKDENKKSLYLLFSIFFWFVGYQGVLATFSNYAVHHLNVSAKEGSFIILFFAAFFLLSAIPAGMIGEKLGKKKTIVIGLTILIFSYLILSLVKIEYSIGPLHYNHIMMILFAIGGLGWALVNINSYPYIVEGIDEGLYGTYTGMYYFFSSLAAILGPLVMGIFIDIIGFGSMFPVAVIAFVFAYFMMKKKY